MNLFTRRHRSRDVNLDPIWERRTFSVGAMLSFALLKAGTAQAQIGYVLDIDGRWVLDNNPSAGTDIQLRHSREWPLTSG